MSPIPMRIWLEFASENDDARGNGNNSLNAYACENHSYHVKIKFTLRKKVG